MNVIRIRNVHRVLPMAMAVIKGVGIKRNSRNGEVLVSPDPVSTVYMEPRERVLFWSERDANPFFHFFEMLWMLGGRNDVKSMTRFIKNFSNYSDDGERFHGAYGYRWRTGMPADSWSASTQDQLSIIIKRLQSDKDDRRCVLQMWDSQSDLGRPSKDVPCNTMATFQVGGDGRLNLVVFNRSNDIIWGAYGANAVQFSGLLEYVASFAGIPVGTYTQISVNWHAYISGFEPLYKKFEETAAEEFNLLDPFYLSDQPCPYETGQVKVYPMVTPGITQEQWDGDLQKLLRYSGKAPTSAHFNEPFFKEVAYPILHAHDIYKAMEGRAKYEQSMQVLTDCRASDWSLACIEWIQRRFAKWNADNE